MKYSLLIIGLFAVYLLSSNYLKKRYSDLLTGYLMDQKYEEFDKLIDKPLVKYAIHPFNRDYLKLNRYQMAADEKKTSEMFALFKERTLNKTQKKDIYPKAFNHYLLLSDKKECHYYRDRISELDDEDLKNIIDLEYRIFIEKKSDMLDDLLKKTEKLEETDRGFYEFLISGIYRNTGNHKKAQEYTELSQKHILKK